VWAPGTNLSAGRCYRAGGAPFVAQALLFVPRRADEYVGEGWWPTGDRRIAVSIFPFHPMLDSGAQPVHRRPDGTCSDPGMIVTSPRSNSPVFWSRKIARTLFGEAPMVPRLTFFKVRRLTWAGGAARLFLAKTMSGPDEPRE